MTQSFYDRPILNSPYEEPKLHHALDEEGQPLELPPIAGRRPCDFVTPVPKPKKKSSKAAQAAMVFEDELGLSADEQEYNAKPIIDEIRSHVASWRALPSDRDWGVTPATAKLLHHWRRTEVEGVRPFFCQVEAVETIIWLTEVASQRKQYAHLWEHVRAANKQSSPDLLRPLERSTSQNVPLGPSKFWRIRFSEGLARDCGRRACLTLQSPMAYLCRCARFRGQKLPKWPQ